MRTRIITGTFAAALVLLPADTQAQGIEGGLESLALENAQLYVSPVANGLGMALGSGFAQTARPHNRFGFDLGVRVMGSIVPEAGKTFQAVLPGTASYDGSTYNSPYGFEAGSTGRSPTAAGKGEGVEIVPQGDFRNAIIAGGENPDNYNLRFPEGVNLPAVPFAVIQGSVGVGFGTELILRLVPSYEIDEELGEVSAFGFGVKHSIDQWIPSPLPVRVSGLVGQQKFKVGDYLDARSTTVGLIASRGFGLVSFYGTAAYESSKVDVSYTVENPDDNPALPADGTSYDFSFDNNSGTRVGAGIGFNLLILDLSGEYSIGTYNTASVKIGISFN